MATFEVKIPQQTIDEARRRGRIGIKFTVECTFDENFNLVPRNKTDESDYHPGNEVEISSVRSGAVANQGCQNQDEMSTSSKLPSPSSQTLGPDPDGGTEETGASGTTPTTEMSINRESSPRIEGFWSMRPLATRTHFLSDRPMGRVEPYQYRPRGVRTNLRRRTFLGRGRNW